VTINERIEAGRRERRVMTRVSRAAWRLEQAERERTWALVSARGEGISICTLAAAAGLPPCRVHQIVAAADLDALNGRSVSCGQQAGTPPEDPDSGEDTELSGRDSIAGGLCDEVRWLRQPRVFRSVTNTGPDSRPLSSCGSSLAVPLCQTMMSIAPPFRRTRGGPATEPERTLSRFGGQTGGSEACPWQAGLS
jgi:hypothetical protein